MFTCVLVDQCIYCTALTEEGSITLYYVLNVCFCVCVIGRHSLVLCSFFTGNMFNCRNVSSSVSLLQGSSRQQIRLYIIYQQLFFFFVFFTYFTHFLFFFFNSFPKTSVYMWTRPFMRCLISFSFLYSKW